MAHCSCGKEIEDKYKQCYDCFRKREPVSTEVKKANPKRKSKENGFTDLNKPVTIPLWAAIGLFLAGAAIAIWLF